MAKSFSATVAAWAKAVPERYEAVVKMAAQDLVSLMQTPGPSVANPSASAGGHMPIRDGYLRSSLLATTDGSMPSATRKPKDGITYSWNPVGVNLAINGAALGDRITLAYTAEYGRFMEARYAFVVLAAQKWPSLVSQANAAARAASGT